MHDPSIPILGENPRFFLEKSNIHAVSGDMRLEGDAFNEEILY